MDEAERFRAHAKRCRADAMSVTDENERGRLLKMAAAWDTFANQSERKAANQSERKATRPQG